MRTPPKSDGSGKRILLVENNRINQLLASTILKKSGYQVDIAGDDRAVNGSLEAADYDVILMDVETPVMDGTEATEDNCNHAPTQKMRSTPIIAMMANATAGDMSFDELDSRSQMRRLAYLRAKADHEGVARIAHEIAGSSANFSATKLAGLAQQLKQIAVTHPDATGYQALTEDINARAAASREALENHFSGRKQTRRL